MDFEWQTTEAEDEERWQEGVEETGAGPPSRRRRWLVLLLTLALAATAAFLLYREGQQRIEESAALLEEDVLSSHQLGQTALERQDLELFTTILSGREPAWTEAQKERLETGLLYQQSPSVLGLVPVAAVDRSPEVSFDAELREATVTEAWRYRLPGGEVSETITLTQTAVYRKGSDRWLLSPTQQEDFWGNWRTREREHVTLTYPVRDERVALALARYLDQKVAEMCTMVVCPADYEVRVRLERAPQSLLPLLDPEQGLIGRQTIILPTPTLVGLPVSDEAHEALFQGYARHLLSSSLLDLADWRCCDHVLFQQALLHRQLAALGVAPEPVNDVDYLYLPDQIPDQEQLRRWWREDEPAASQAEIPIGLYVFLDFFRVNNDFDGNPFTLQPLLEPVLSGWLESNRRSTQFDWEDEWPAFIRHRVQDVQAAIPMPSGLAFPEGQEVVLLCQNATREAENIRSIVVHYDPASQTWSDATEVGPGYSMLALLPDDDGYFLSHQRPSRDTESLRFDTYLYRVGQSPILVAGGEEAERGMVPFSWFKPGGGKMLAWTFAPGEDGLESGYSLLIPDSCTADGCHLEQARGFPVWSPDGQQMLAISFDNAEVILRRKPDSTWDEVGRGYSAFWLNNEIYGVVEQRSPGAAEAVWLSRVGEDEPERWLPAEMLAEALPEGHSAYSLGIAFAFAHPLAENRFVLVASTNQGTELFLIGRDSEAEDWLESEPVVRHLDTIPVQPTGAPMPGDIAKSGRPWLALPLTGDGTGFWLYDLVAEETLLEVREGAGPGFYLQSYDWSADGVWLARPAGGALDLIAPGFKVDGRPYRQYIFHDYGGCSAVGWLNRN